MRRNTASHGIRKPVHPTIGAAGFVLCHELHLDAQARPGGFKDCHWWKRGTVLSVATFATQYECERDALAYLRGQCARGVNDWQ